jgi:hypothetical protein
MRTKIVELYEYDELLPDAQKEARTWFRDTETEIPFLSENMHEKAKELIEEAGMTCDNMRIMYSLSCCQGDGAMVQGGFTWKGYSVNVTHIGHYYHFNSKNFTIYNAEGEEVNDEKLEEEFDNLYTSICKKLEKFGYDCIEAEESDENVAETIRLNEYTFTKDGKRED